jgi:hypothetical protein
MSAVIVLTPIVISSWPAITAAVVGAATAMGFSLQGERLHEEEEQEATSVETEIEETQIVSEGLAPGQTIVVQRGDVRIEFGQDQRGRCTVCASGARRSKRELQRIADEIAGRVTQQFIYNKLLHELRERNYTVVGEERLADDSVRVRVRL